MSQSKHSTVLYVKNGQNISVHMSNRNIYLYDTGVKLY